MRNIRIITVGKLKEKYLTQGCEEYLKRLALYARVQVFELDESRLPERPSQGQIDAALAAEGEKILDKAKGSALVALCVEGDLFASEQLAAKLDALEVGGSSAISFVIGSSFGLAEVVKQSAAVRLSFSRMTFPHQLMRVILAEQVYRAFMINSGSTYHK